MTDDPEIFLFKHRILDVPYQRWDKKAQSAILGFTGQHAFLSNFAAARYEVDGNSFFSSEQGYMWEKDSDPAYRAKVMAAQTSRQCKHLGYKAKLPPGWDERLRYEAMFKHVDAKFSVPYNAERLLATEWAYLEETNRHGDRHWGVMDGEGENHLGRILMCVRYKRYMERHERLKRRGTSSRR